MEKAVEEAGGRGWSREGQCRHEADPEVVATTRAAARAVARAAEGARVAEGAAKAGQRGGHSGVTVGGAS